MDISNCKIHNHTQDVTPNSKTSADVSEGQVAQIQKRLLDTSLPMPHRFRAVFSLRNIQHPNVVDALASGLNDKSALLKHEIAYVLGQIQVLVLSVL